MTPPVMEMQKARTVYGRGGALYRPNGEHVPARWLAGVWPRDREYSGSAFDLVWPTARIHNVRKPTDSFSRVSQTQGPLSAGCKTAQMPSERKLCKGRGVGERKVLRTSVWRGASASPWKVRGGTGPYCFAIPYADRRQTATLESEL